MPVTTLKNNKQIGGEGKGDTVMSEQVPKFI